MKRFMLFIFQNYYPDGGMNDFVCSCDTVEDAKKSAEEYVSSICFSQHKMQIYDIEANQVVVSERIRG
jgi:hypothetical protein